MVHCQLQIGVPPYFYSYKSPETFRFLLVSTGKAVKILASDTGSRLHRAPGSSQSPESLKGAGERWWVPRLCTGAGGTWDWYWWPFSAIQTVVGPEATGRVASFQLLRKELTEHLNLGLKARCIRDLGWDLWSEYGTWHPRVKQLTNWVGSTQLCTSLPTLKLRVAQDIKDEGRCFTDPQVNPKCLKKHLDCFLGISPASIQFWGSQPPKLQSSAGCTRSSCLLWGSWSPALWLTQTSADAFSSAFSTDSYPTNG